jgi:hypothetical protein
MHEAAAVWLAVPLVPEERRIVRCLERVIDWIAGGVRF